MSDDQEVFCGSCRNYCHGHTVTTYNDNGEVLRIVCGDCDLAERVARYMCTRVIESRLLLSAVCRTTDDDWSGEVRASYERIKMRVKYLERSWWLGAVQQMIDASSQRGWRADHALLTMLVWSCAGRTMVTLERHDGDHITLIAATSETGSTMGVQGIQATETTALAILDDAIRAHEAGALTLVPDDKVGMI